MHRVTGNRKTPVIETQVEKFLENNIGLREYL